MSKEVQILSDRMRIGILCHSSFGGSARIGKELAVALSLRGHCVHLFTRSGPILKPNVDRAYSFQHHVLNAEVDLPSASLYTQWTQGEQKAYLDRILQVIHSSGLDILHFHYAVPFAFIAASLKRILQNDCPYLIGTLHGTDVTHYGKYQISKPMLADVLPQIDRLTTVSQYYAYLSFEVFGLTKPPTVIPNFVDLKWIQKSCIRGNITSNKRKPIIAHVSNFRPVKDTHSLGQIFMGIRQQLDAELWLIGDGPDLSKLKTRLNSTLFANDLKFWGFQDNVYRLLQQADILLMTSKEESFCLAALEAMSCGVPVLSTSVGGIPELVKDGVTGFLFPVGAIAQAIDLGLELLTNHKLYKYMQTAAINRAQNYSQDLVVPMYESIYQLRSRIEKNRFKSLGVAEK